MRGVGRPRNTAIRLALLERLPNESVGEILRSGSLTRRQLGWYLRDLTRLRLIEPRSYLSHLPTDGPGAKRYGLTRLGRRRREQWRRTETPHRGRTEITVSEGVPAPARVEVRPLSPVTKASSQRYVGVHNLAFTMAVESSFRRPFGWERQYPMRGGWIKRHAPFGRGIHIEESGGSRWDPPGAAGHTITVKFRVDGPDPEGNEARAQETVGLVRRTLEQEYGCSLSDPILRSAKKHSVVGDPVALLVRKAGVAVHGDTGVDDTPEPGTLEFRAADEVKRYVKGVEAVGTLGEKVDALIGKTEELRVALAAVVDATGQQAEAMKALLDRLPRPAEVKPPAPIPNAREAGYG